VNISAWVAEIINLKRAIFSLSLCALCAAVLWRRWHQHMCAAERAAAIKQMLCNVTWGLPLQGRFTSKQGAHATCGCQRRVHLRTGRILLLHANFRKRLYVSAWLLRELAQCRGEWLFASPGQLVSPIICQLCSKVGERKVFFYTFCIRRKYSLI
jgi:hypothetical protein